MTINRRALAGTLAVLLLVAACGGSASSSPASAAPGATATPAAVESQAPGDTQAPEATPEATDGPQVSLAPGAASDLEAMLPDEVNGVKFQKSSFDGSSFPGGIPIGAGDDAFAKFLSDNGKSLKDVSMAVATPTDAAAGGSMVMAIQVAGVPADKMTAWAANDLTDMQKTTIAGKDVYGAAAAGTGAYVYFKDDVVFYVLALGGANLAEGIISKLP